ncbi:MAG: 3-deoxy-D-manno-octulosonic acid transferase [Candidatus Omnitrophota bacterium]|nr:3-deoxy-D-manno-octulosonic acid transferase [Candidatus Omnitrophota bacterium]
MNILFLFYDFIFFLGFILYLPFYIKRKKINLSAIKEKFGFFPGVWFENSIWIQVVSVGEANVIEKLIHRLREVYDYPIVITTTTLTGNRLAKKKYASSAKILYFPFDISLVLRKVIKILNPKVFIAVETEIWPNLFYNLRQKHIPIVLINGRVSDKAFKHYNLVRPIIKRLLNLCNHIGVQNAYYKDKFISLGCAKDKITISGNMKFDSICIDEKHLGCLKQKFLPILKRKDSFLLVAGSTHHPEEETIFDIYKSLISVGKNISLLIAPRHIERIPILEKQINALGFTPIKISQINEPTNDKNNIFLLDTIGELLYFYSLADICFVGGSLANYGGHNILEPIYFLKPTVFGPYMDNFKDVEEIILTKGAGIQVNDNIKLKEVLSQLIDDQTLRSSLRVKCLDVFEEERKSLDENLKIILKCLPR